MKRPVQRHVKHLLSEVSLRIQYAERELSALRDIERSLRGRLNGLDMVVVEQGLDISQMSQSDAAEVLLRKHGPMRCMALVDALMADGYPGPSGGSLRSRRARLGNSLFSTLTKQPHRFVKTADHVWHLAKAGQANRNERSKPKRRKGA